MFGLSLFCLAITPPSLISQSHAIASIADWHREVNRTAQYEWIDPSTLLFLTKGRNNETILHTLNTRTKQVSGVGLSLPFNETQGEIDHLSVSPNGKKLLWSGGTEDRPMWFVADLNGSEFVQFPRKKANRRMVNSGADAESLLHWSADSRSTYETLLDYAGSTKTLVWQRPLDSVEHEHNLPNAYGYLDYQPQLVGKNIAFGQRGLAAGRDKPSIGFTTWSFETPGANRKDWSVRVPKNRTIASFAVSHSGTQILWDLGIKDAKHQGAFEWAGEEFWISDLAGKKWGCLGRIKTDISDTNALGNPAWRPDDKAISFAYKNKLYELKVR